MRKNFVKGNKYKNNHFEDYFIFRLSNRRKRKIWILNDGEKDRYPRNRWHANNCVLPARLILDLQNFNRIPVRNI